MAKINGQQNINIGLPNEAANSDSLYTAFNKIQNNFSTLFNTAANVIAGNGITITNNTGNTVVEAKLEAGENISLANTANGIQINAAGERYLSNSSTTLSVEIGNSKSLIIGANLSYIPAQTVIVAYDGNNYMTGPVVSYNRSNGNLVFNSVSINGTGTYSAWTVNLNGAAGGNGGGTITGVTAGTGLTGGGNVGPVTLTLSNSGVNAATYTNPTIVVDQYGRIVNASNNSVSGTVTSIGLNAGPGIQIGGGPITTAGTITVTNTGVTRIIAGNNIAVSTGGNGNVTIDATNFTGVTSVLLQSSTLNVTPTSAQTTSAVFNVNLPNTVVRWTTVPSTNTSAGVAGQAAYDSGGNLYVCVATNTWAKFTGSLSW